MLAQQPDIGARIGQHIVHARFGVRRFRHRSEKLDAHRHQPAQGIVRIVHEQAAQDWVVAAGIGAGEFGHVVEMGIRAVVDPGLLLLWRAGGGERADRPGGRAAEGIVLFDQDGGCAACLRFDRGGKTGAPAADDEHVACGVFVIRHRYSPRFWTA